MKEIEEPKEQKDIYDLPFEQMLENDDMYFEWLDDYKVLLETIKEGWNDDTNK